MFREAPANAGSKSIGATAFTNAGDASGDGSTAPRPATAAVRTNPSPSRADVASTSIASGVAICASARAANCA